MSWQIAQNSKPGRSRPVRLYASLNRRGEIVLGQTAWRWLGDLPRVTLLYDAAQQMIGVKSPVGLDLHFFPLCKYGRGKRQRIVRARKMIRDLGIEVDTTLVFQGVQRATYDGENMLVLDLKTATFSRR